MIILGISISHNSSAALMRDGEIIAACCEERYLRKKNYSGFPLRAIRDCMKLGQVSVDEIDAICLSSLEMSGIHTKSQQINIFTVEDYWRYFADMHGDQNIRSDYLRYLRDDDRFQHDDDPLNYDYLNNDHVLLDPNRDFVEFRELIASYLSDELGFANEKIHFVDHHTCHAYYAY